MAYNIYGYEPSEAGAYISAAIFAVLFLAVLALNIRYKTWFFMVVPIASIMELIGFVLRPDSEYNVKRYIVSTLGILLAPTVFAMADYTLISRM